jgi:hypothetical protein
MGALLCLRDAGDDDRDGADRRPPTSIQQGGRVSLFHDARRDLLQRVVLSQLRQA